MRVLVVDDSRALRALLTRMLTGLGFEAVSAGNGQEAIESLDKEGRFDIALVDWNMPVMNGLDFVRAVRGRAELEHLVIMMVTTETEIERITVALEAGANEYLMKPFTSEALADKLSMLGFPAAA